MSDNQKWPSNSSAKFWRSLKTDQNTRIFYIKECVDLSGPKHEHLHVTKNVRHLKYPRIIHLFKR